MVGIIEREGVITNVKIWTDVFARIEYPDAAVLVVFPAETRVEQKVGIGGKNQIVLLA